MKHTAKITIILIIIFVLTQIIGLTLIKLNGTPQFDEKTGEVIAVEYEDSGTIKPMENESNLNMITAISLLIGILIGTGIVLLLAKFKVRRVWKYWFSFVVVIGLHKAFEVLAKSIVPHYGIVLKTLILVTAITLAYLKAFKPNPITHNLTELFIYGGIALILVQVLNVYTAAILLILISIYDMIAVWKSKHMIKLAEFQIDSKAFAGLSIPYSLMNKTTQKENKKTEKNKKTNILKKATITKISTKTSKKTKDNSERNAILGGGDMAFPLFFTGAVMEAYNSYSLALIITLTTTIALAGLFYFGKKDRFYPAMPFISTGCFIGWAIIWGITNLI